MTQTELSVLETLWNTGKPLCASEILQANPTIKEITLRTTMKNMLEKNLIKVSGITRRTKNFARTFLPTISQEEFYLKNVPADAFKFACAIVQSDTLSENQLETLKAIIEEREKKNL